jgi:hypothetical protein
LVKISSFGNRLIIFSELSIAFLSVGAMKGEAVYYSKISDDKSLRLEVHNAKRFDDICKENNYVR